MGLHGLQVELWGFRTLNADHKTFEKNDFIPLASSTAHFALLSLYSCKRAFFTFLSLNLLLFNHSFYILYFFQKGQLPEVSTPCYKHFKPKLEEKQ